MSRATLAVDACGRISLFSCTHRFTRNLSFASSAFTSRFSGVVNGAE